ncbi:acylphosphatase [Sphingomonas sp.]|uniref:acylphosphatase n=1 Tax=Sphingomonas sp. TaxID=28214 RepID=UPI002BD16AF0|nr:acylphosphatase [Sphingomonas sp.]HWK35309.1 acylphosphatase [Sphingomonas sp.]
MQMEQQMQRLLVSGRVQQVGYRDWMVRKAQSLGITGWVRNLTDGRVEMVAAGEEQALAAFVEAGREGPRLARIDAIDVHPASERPMKGFTKRFTA